MDHPMIGQLEELVPREGRYCPALVRCTCGREFYLQNEYYGTCECPGCGRWWNLSGQAVLAPDEYDIDSTY